MNVEGSNKRLTWNMILVQNLKSYQLGIVDYIILTWCTFFVLIQLHFVNLYYCVENPDPAIVFPPSVRTPSRSPNSCPPDQE